MNINYRRYLPILFKALIFALICLFIYYIGLPLAVILMPFIIASIIALAMEPLVSFFHKKLKLKRKLASLFSLICVLLSFISIISLVIYKIVVELTKLSNAVPAYFKGINLNNEVKYLTDLSQKFYLNIPEEASTLIQNKLSEAVTSASGYLTSFLTSMLSFTFDTVKYLPQILIFVIITTISTYFISSDRDRIRDFIFKQFNESWQIKITALKNDLFFALVGFIKAQLIIIFLSILVVSTGLTILGVEYAITLGILIGSAEILPVVGIGTILVPWVIYSLITKKTTMAVGLACVYLFGLIMRHSTEPKIIGSQIGLYPLVTLISIYVGLKLFGVVGLILGPILVIVVRNLNKSGIISLWKE